MTCTVCRCVSHPLRSFPKVNPVHQLCSNCDQERVNEYKQYKDFGYGVVLNVSTGVIDSLKKANPANSSKPIVEKIKTPYKANLKEIRSVLNKKKKELILRERFTQKWYKGKGDVGHRMYEEVLSREIKAVEKLEASVTPITPITQLSVLPVAIPVFFPIFLPFQSLESLSFQMALLQQTPLQPISERSLDLLSAN